MKILSYTPYHSSADVLEKITAGKSRHVVIENLVKAVAEADDMPHLRVIVGGAPVTQEFATDIGADGWAPDAASAVDVAKAVVETARGDTELSGLIYPEALRAGAGA